jgi:hypothetical protein
MISEFLKMMLRSAYLGEGEDQSEQPEWEQPESQPNRFEAERDLRKYLAEGELEFSASSWTLSASGGDAGCSAFLKALEIQIRLRGGDAEHPSLASTHLWVGKSYHKLKEHGESMKYHRTALKIQLQKVGQYDPLTAEILHSMAGLYSDAGTPAAASQAQVLEDAALRVKWRTHGKNEACARVDHHHCGGMTSWESLRHEMTGDHHLLVSEAGEATSKYREAALTEYLERGSNNMNLALLFRRIAISSLSEASRAPVDADPLGALLSPTCMSPMCGRIRRGDEYLVEARYEAAIGSYASRAPNQIDDGSAPWLNSGASSVAMGTVTFTLLLVTVFGKSGVIRLTHTLAAFETADKEKRMGFAIRRLVEDFLSRVLEALHPGSEQTVSGLPHAPVRVSQPFNLTAVGEVDRGGSDGQEPTQITEEAKRSNASKEPLRGEQSDQTELDSVHESFGRQSFESLGSIMERDGSANLDATDLADEVNCSFFRFSTNRS